MHHPDDMERTWEQREEESDRAYHAFCIFRDLEGQEQTIHNAYRRWANRGASWSGSPSGSFKGWARDFEWVARARDYSVWQTLHRQRLREREHMARLEAHREHLHREAVRSGAMARALFDRLQPALRELETDGLSATELVKLMRLAMDLNEMSVTQQGAALAVDELVDVLGGAGELVTGE